jgi:Asp-tRNA(Asn)/Glu-tRNA(Gln) amidotransferase A subunit family amidase
MLAHFRDICIKLSEAGYRVKSVAMMPNFADIRERHLIITAGDAARVHRNWFPRYRELYHPKTVELLERGQDVTDEVLNDLRMRCNAFRSGLTMAMEAEGIDLWIAPSAIGPAPEGLDSTGDPIMNLPWTQVGFPALNIPSGQSANSLPLGLQLAGGWGADESLFEWGRAIEQVLTEGQ